MPYLLPIFIILIVLKLTILTTMSWWIVFLPVFFGIGLFVFIMLSAVGIIWANTR